MPIMKRSESSVLTYNKKKMNIMETKEMITEYKVLVNKQTAYKELIESAIDEGIVTEIEICSSPMWRWADKRFGEKEAELRHKILKNLVPDSEEYNEFVNFVGEHNLQHGHRMAEYHKKGKPQVEERDQIIKRLAIDCISPEKEFEV